MIGHQNFQNGGTNFAPYTPAYASPLYGNQYTPPQQPQNQPQVNNQQQSIQYSSVVLVRSEEQARNYPVGPGVSVTFKNESLPYIYTKTMGFNQLEQPVFKRYKLIEEEDPVVDTRSDEIEELRSQIQDLRELIKNSTSKTSSNKRSKEDTVND